jgi:probable phosphoglycerate mutase
VGLAAEADPEPDLVEWNYGDYEGKRTVDIHQERPRLECVARWLSSW